MTIQPQAIPPAAALALKPVWIHDLLVLWRRNQPLALLLERASGYVAQEVRSEPVRRAYIEAIAALFVERRGIGPQARTLAQNVWASYSRNFTVWEMAPAYLAHLAARRPRLYELAVRLGQDSAPGSLVDGEALLHQGAQPPADERQAELEAALRLLQHFGVLAPARPGRRYRLVKRLAVVPEVFPLLVWCWWEGSPAPCVELETFRRSPLFAFLETADFMAGWMARRGKVWRVEQEGEQLLAHIYPADRASFVRALLNLLSAGGQRGRQWPRKSDPMEAAQESLTQPE
ncbi:MAG TPA: hypothetical protein VNK95_07105 [Caldilineaceae bacterium]|nr:hypothetical protein [Caldilineaceae bacterium]